MKTFLYFLGGLIILGGLWWWFGGGGPRGGPVEAGIFVDRNDRYEDYMGIVDGTDDVRLFGFKLINATGTDIVATSTAFIIDPSSTFDPYAIKNVRLYYNDEQVGAAAPTFLFPHLTNYMFSVAVPTGINGQFWLIADLHGTSTATTTLRILLTDMHVEEASGEDSFVKRLVNNLRLWLQNNEPSAWLTISPQ